MQVSHLDHIENIAERVADNLQSDSPRSWEVTGAETVGKSTTLRRVAQRLEERERDIPVMVSPPRKALDAGQVAMLQVAGQLKDAGLINGELETFLEDEECSWFDQQRLVHQWLDDHSDRVVLLCDEPDQWSLRAGASRHFDQQTSQVIQLLRHQTSCRRVVTGKSKTDLDVHHIELNGRPRYHHWLAEQSDQWGELADTARQLWDCFEQQLQPLSPLKIRLLVGIAHLRSLDWLQRRFDEFSGGSRNRLTNELIDLSTGTSWGEAFRLTWDRCSLVREPLEQRLVEDFMDGQPGGPTLDQPLRDVLTRCILYPAGDSHYILHDILRLTPGRETGRWLSSHQKRQTHKFLATYYGERLEERTESNDVGQALRCEFEGFHHVLNTGKEELRERFRVFFVEQLNLLGKHLSDDLNDYPQATKIFERAVRRDDDNDYSHHYLAFNLDIQGREAQRVERHYRKAVRLEDGHPWWWSRWVCFLITRGRIVEARDQWEEALDALELPNPEVPDSYYKSLHRSVARLLLHSGKLNFAQRVLESVPQRAKEDISGFRAMEEYLHRLREAEQFQSVFPGYIPVAQRWQGPHLIPEEHQGEPLVRWLPARVEGVDDGCIYLVCAERLEGEEEPRFARMTIPTQKFDDWGEGITSDTIEEGRFLELGIYGHPDADPLIQIHSKQSYEPDLPRLFPDPDRYLPDTDH